MHAFPRLEALFSRWRTSPGDAALALALTVLVGQEAPSPAVGVPLAVVLLSAPGLLALAWRRTWPDVVAYVVLGVTLLLSALATGPFPPQLAFLAVLLAVYTAAAHLSGARAVVAGALTLGLVTTAHVVTGDGDAGDFLPWLVWGAPWTAGRLVRRRTLEAAAAATRAAWLVQQAEAQEREAAARERDRIARELHDVVAHGVSLMVVQAGAERLRLGRDQTSTRDVLTAIESAGREALAELRTMLGVLRAGGDDDERLAPQPDLGQLHALAERVAAAGLPVHLDVDPGATEDVPHVLAMSAYRIVQEALTNVVKHAPGSPASVRVAREREVLRLQVVSPLPPVPVQATRGRGLIGISERAALHGGTAHFGPQGRDWVVDVELPLPAVVVPT